jgi:AbrB family looped-hinge helix DNA binding protein
MNATLTIDKAGRVVLPKPVRDAVQISPGDSLELESSEDHIILRPAKLGRACTRSKECGCFTAMPPFPQAW